MRDLDIFPRPSAEHAAALGYVAYHWTLVEGQLAYAITVLLGLHNHAGNAVTAELPMMARTNLAHTLIGLTGNVNLIEEWRLIETDLNAARAERNDMIHGVWEVVGNEHLRTRTKAKQRITVSVVSVSTAQLNELCERIHDLQQRIARITVLLARAEAYKTINQHDPPGPPLPSTQTSKSLSPDRIPKAQRKAARKAKASAVRA